MSDYWEVWSHGFWPGLCLGMMIYHNVVGYVLYPRIELAEKENEELRRRIAALEGK